MATSSGWSLTGRLITKHLGALGTTIAGMIANFDPETATEADRDALAARLRDIAGRHAKAKAEWQKEEADVVALRKQIATDTDVAAKLGERLAAGTVTEDAVNLFLDELQAAQDRLPQEEAEAQDAKAFLDELQALVAQMSEQLAQFDAHATKVKRELERAKAARRPFTRAGTYAKRFAAKEAFSKAVGTGFKAGVFMKDIGVVNAPSGAPTLALTGGAKARLDALTPAGHLIRVHLTLTDDHPWAQAFVVIEALLKA